MTDFRLTKVKRFGTHYPVPFKNSENDNLRRVSSVNYPVIPDKYLPNVRP